MGGGSQSSSSENNSKSSSTSRTYASELSTEQLKILQERNAQYTSYFFPELQKAISATNSDSAETAATMANQASQINTAYNSGMQNLNQNLAQQGIAGDASGVQAALNQAQQRGRSSALAQAYYKTLSDNTDKKTALLGIASTMMPKATTDSSYYQESESESSGSGSGSGSGWNATIR